MSAKSSKSRFAAMALMALGVSTFMGTSAALATTGVGVSGTVGCTESSSSMTASGVAFGNVPKGEVMLAYLTPDILLGKKTDCTNKTATVKAEIKDASLGGEAAKAKDYPVVLYIPEDPTSGVFEVKATVPSGAGLGTFSATVTLTISDAS